MKTLFAILSFSILLALAPGAAEAHCDAVDGPVATAAVKALEARNVNLVLVYVPAEAEPEVVAAFEEAVVVRGQGAAARTLADRYFMETAVRLHRAGEKAPYTGLKPAGTDFGPAIPAAEKALATRELPPLGALVGHVVEHGLAERFQHATQAAGSKEPETRAGVAAGRERASAELAFIGYVEALYRAALGTAPHAE